MTLFKKHILLERKIDERIKEVMKVENRKKQNT